MYKKPPTFAYAERGRGGGEVVFKEHTTVHGQTTEGKTRAQMPSLINLILLSKPWTNTLYYKTTQGPPTTWRIPSVYAAEIQLEGSYQYILLHQNEITAWQRCLKECERRHADPTVYELSAAAGRARYFVLHRMRLPLDHAIKPGHVSVRQNSWCIILCHG